MFLNLCAYNKKSCTGALEYTLVFSGRRHIEADVFRRGEWRLRESGTAILLELANAEFPPTLRTPANENFLIEIFAVMGCT